MMVTFVSQCEKKALSRTRRVLDSFADRIGDNTWQMGSTQEDLPKSRFNNQIDLEATWMP